jgi:small-conductance mechanosensitive channel
VSEGRSVFRFSLVQSTSAEDLARVPTLVADAACHPLVRFERAHFVGFGAASLDFEVSIVVASADYRAYLDAQQTVMLEIVRSLSQHGLTLAARPL